MKRKVVRKIFKMKVDSVITTLDICIASGKMSFFVSENQSSSRINSKFGRLEGQQAVRDSEKVRHTFCEFAVAT